MSDKDLARRGFLLLALLLFVALPSSLFYQASRASAHSLNAIEVSAANAEAQIYPPSASPTLDPSPTPIAPDQPDTTSNALPSQTDATTDIVQNQPDAPLPAAPDQSDAQPIGLTTQQYQVTIDQIPTTLDEAWYWIENGEHGFVFDIPCPSLAATPFVNWDMAEELAHGETPGRRHPFIEVDASTIARIAAQGNLTFEGSGTITKNEEDVYAELVPLLEGGSIQICGEGKPTLYGEGLQEFLDWLAQ
ncbi:MAG TPA: hypothetical protein VMC09_07690 [Anaerolineales bacterium]|nr:hypothetical protein [Anaerolineales bacterium]